MSAQSISYETDVPSGRIYDVLSSLQSRGAVVATGLKPAVYDAQSPRFVLMSALTNLESNIDKALASAEQAFEKRTPDNNEVNPKTWVVTGREGIAIQARRLLSETKTSVNICDHDISWFGRRDYNTLKQMAREKKEVKILSSSNFAEDLEDLEDEGIEVRIANIDSSFYLADKSRILIKSGSNPPQAIFMDDATMVSRFLKEFQRDFRKAKAVKVTEVAH